LTRRRRGRLPEVVDPGAVSIDDVGEVTQQATGEPVDPSDLAPLHAA
jgi:hypothetical protein